MKTLKNYYEACYALADEFNKRYFYGEAEMYAIGDEPDGVWVISDYFFNIQNMAQAIEFEFTEDELFDWYDQWIDEKTGEKVNMKNYKKLNQNTK